MYTQLFGGGAKVTFYLCKPQLMMNGWMGGATTTTAAAERWSANSQHRQSVSSSYYAQQQQQQQQFQQQQQQTRWAEASSRQVHWRPLRGLPLSTAALRGEGGYAQKRTKD